MARTNSEISRTAIRERVRMQLWAVSGGRCELCNRLLYQDLVYGQDGNFGEMAHIHAVSESGPRNKRGMTSEEKNSVENLMLLCEEHHHMIDTFPDKFRDGLLLKKKRAHEARIREVTEISSEQTTRIVTYFSNIDHYEVFSSDRLLREAVLFADRVPMQEPTIHLSSDSYIRYVPAKEIFQQKEQDLEKTFRIWFDDVIKKQDSISLFALAPQPLLFKLGTLINDQYNAIVFQRHRTGHTWAWPNLDSPVEYIFSQTRVGVGNCVALVLDLSASVADDRIISALGESVSIFHITLPAPCRTFVTSKKVQDDFVSVFRVAMEHIKNLRPAPVILHIFPAMPSSLAIRAGMDYMPKADLPVVLYEQADQADGFFEALIIGG